MKRKTVIEMNIIKSALALKGRTSDELAEFIGVHPVTVSKWATNKIQPDIRNVYLIADFLDMEMTDLYKKKEDVIGDVREWHRERMEAKEKG